MNKFLGKHGELSRTLSRVRHPRSSMIYRTLLVLVASSCSALQIGVGDKFPAPALSKFGCSGKKSVVFFYGADDAPSCSKQIMGMDEALPEFESMGVSVVGVRNPSGVKLADDPSRLKLVVDEDDAVRNDLEIPKDFFVLGGRQSYVIDSTGTVTCVHNNQCVPSPASQSRACLAIRARTAHIRATHACRCDGVPQV